MSSTFKGETIKENKILIDHDWLQNMQGKVALKIKNLVTKMLIKMFGLIIIIHYNTGCETVSKSVAKFLHHL